MHELARALTLAFDQQRSGACALYDALADERAGARLAVTARRRAGLLAVPSADERVSTSERAEAQRSA